LKQLNDTRGHAAGDAAILKVAKILASNVRESDIVGRLGGDEFGVMLSHADEDAARSKAEFLAESIAADPLEWEGGTIVLEVALRGSHDPRRRRSRRGARGSRQGDVRPQDPGLGENLSDAPV